MNTQAQAKDESPSPVVQKKAAAAAKKTLTIADVVFDVSGSEMTLQQESDLAKALSDEYIGTTYEASNIDELTDAITTASGFCVQSVRAAVEGAD